MLPYYNDEYTLRLTFKVAAGQTVRPGFPVKIANAAPADPNIIEVQEALLTTDQAIGIACGSLVAENPEPTYQAGAKVNLTMTFLACIWGVAGTAGVTMGKRVVPSSTGLTDAPVPIASGTVVYEVPGFALSNGASGEAFALAIQPTVYTA